PPRHRHLLLPYTTLFRSIYQLFVQPPLLRLLLPWLMRRAGRFTEADIQVMKESWRDPAARRAMANYYTALRRHRRALRPLIRPRSEEHTSELQSLRHLVC